MCDWSTPRGQGRHRQQWPSQDQQPDKTQKHCQYALANGYRTDHCRESGATGSPFVVASRLSLIGRHGPHGGDTSQQGPHPWAFHWLTQAKLVTFLVVDDHFPQYFHFKIDEPCSRNALKCLHEAFGEVSEVEAEARLTSRPRCMIMYSELLTNTRTGIPPRQAPTPLLRVWMLWRRQWSTWQFSLSVVCMPGST